METIATHLGCTLMIVCGWLLAMFVIYHAAEWTLKAYCMSRGILRVERAVKVYNKGKDSFEPWELEYLEERRRSWIDERF